MDNQKTLQIVIVALLIISTTMSILTYIALMSMTGGISFNPSSAFTSSNSNNLINNIPQLNLNGNEPNSEPVNILDETISGAPTKDQVHACSAANGHFKCVSWEVERRFGVISDTCTKVACVSN